ncbi:uncharacterized protein FIBRA_03581 [Fibroporia radiculosa]|uniref:Uncharacterized protein n=1 Tax=Fibroporia radiculosa TaxID=599839 RepID=J4GNK0_9APHY|nr:uncharacterized protein FIBRA_03581 [Fibroporia radiculosa]CCM01525.1 predicted protein [Fibroporia radiculosa]
MTDYIIKNYNDWYRLTTTRIGLTVDKGDIVFISGWVKASEWLIGTIVSGGHSAKLSIQAGTDSVANASFSISGTETHARCWIERRSAYSTKPEIDDAALGHDIGHDVGNRKRQKKTKKGKQRAEEATPTPVLNQCIFMHYYKVRRRFLIPQVIRAAAGPSELPWSPRDDGDDSDGAWAMETSEDSLEMVPAVEASYDPVCDVLDYILDNSTAQVAIANTMNVAELQDSAAIRGMVEGNVRRILDYLRPTIVFKQTGVEMLSFTGKVDQEELFGDLGDTMTPKRTANATGWPSWSSGSRKPQLSGALSTSMPTPSQDSNVQSLMPSVYSRDRPLIAANPDPSRLFSPLSTSLISPSQHSSAKNSIPPVFPRYQLYAASPDRFDDSPSSSTLSTVDSISVQHSNIKRYMPPAYCGPPSIIAYPKISYPYTAKDPIHLPSTVSTSLGSHNFSSKQSDHRPSQESPVRLLPLPQEALSLRKISSSGDCGIALDDTSPGGLKRHLRAFHQNDPNYDSERLTSYSWGEGPTKEFRGEVMKAPNLAKHIASAHLKLEVLLSRSKL